MNESVRRRRWAPILVLAVVTSLVQPIAVLAGTSWSVSVSPSTVTASTTNAVHLRVVNTGSTPSDAPIGCITFTMPDVFDITTATVDGVAGGRAWTVDISEGSPSVVTYRAASAGDRLRAGQTPDEDLEGTINVIPSTLGNFSWDVVAYAGIDCTASLGSDKSVTMKVKAVGDANTAPGPGADAYSVKHDEAVIVASPGVLSNDTDAESDALTAVLEDGPANGSLDLGTWGEFTYTPTPGFSGTDSFTYRASDGYATSAPATVTITVTNATPTAAGDSAGVQKGVPYVADAPGVLANDSDADGDAMTAVLVDDVDDGTLTLEMDGSWSYDPDPGFVGTDSFTYHATDGLADSAPATVTLTVTNDAPVTVADGYATHMNDPILESSPGVLANDSDANGDGLTADLVSTTSSGLLLFLGDGSFTYTPDPFWTGTDTFRYRAWDGSAWSTAATVTIAVSNGAPTAVDDDATTTHDTSVGGNVLDNDLDPDDDPLVAGLVTDVGSGTLDLDGDGTWTYTPDPGFVGTDSFTYQVTDGEAVSSPATVSIDVTNAMPVAGDDAATIHHGQTLTVAAPGVLADDSDGDGDAMTVDLAVDVTNGTLTLAADGGYQYVPDPGFVGTDTFTYTVSDGLGTSPAASVIIDVTDTAPIAGDDTWSMSHDQVLAVAAPGVLGGDTDPDGDVLVLALVTGPTAGTLTGGAIDADGAFTYTPDPYFVGSDTFTYEVTDGALTATATVTIEVTNGTPVAMDDALTAHHRGTSVGAAPGVLGNDTDTDGDRLFAILDDDADDGTLVLDPDGSWTYTPDAGFLGPDTFAYTVTDGLSTSAPATVTIMVGDTGPVAGDDTWTVLHDRTLLVAAPGVLQNDADADGDPLAVSVDTPPEHGTLTFGTDGGFSYEPDAGYVGADGFTYSLTDGALGDSATVAIDVINLPPLALPDGYVVDGGASTTVATAHGVLANDSDPNGDSISATLGAGPSDGILALLPDGSFTYTPDPGFAGTDAFTYQATDGVAITSSVVVTIVVLPGPTPPPTPAPTVTPTPPPSPLPTPAPASLLPSATPASTSEPTPAQTPQPSGLPSPSPVASPAPSVAPSPEPPPAAGSTEDQWTIGGIGGDGTGDGTDLPIANLTASLLGLFGQAFDWLVPGALLGMPGLLLLVAVLAQMFGALAWLPVVRRKIGGFGFDDLRISGSPRRS